MHVRQRAINSVFEIRKLSNERDNRLSEERYRGQVVTRFVVRRRVSIVFSKVRDIDKWVQTGYGLGQGSVVVQDGIVRGSEREETGRRSHSRELLRVDTTEGRIGTIGSKELQECSFESGDVRNERQETV